MVSRLVSVLAFASHWMKRTECFCAAAEMNQAWIPATAIQRATRDYLPESAGSRIHAVEARRSPKEQLL